VAFAYPEGTFGGEAVVCPRVGSTAEDDAYLLTYATSRAGDSELYVWSAHDFGEPIAKVKVPQRIPIGYHAYWAPLA
jgi:carotenoid cleavage dioxygenase